MEDLTAILAASPLPSPPGRRQLRPIRSARFLTAAVHQGSLPDTSQAEIAFAGKSNVGKSSLINALLQRKHLARRGARPGLTQALHFFVINEAYRFVDLPGYGYAKVPPKQRQAWMRHAMAYLERRPNLCALVWLVDGRHAPSPLDLDFLQRWRDASQDTYPLLCLWGKADRVPTREREPQARRLRETFAPLLQAHGDRYEAHSSSPIPSHADLWCSARQGEGLPQLWRQLEAVLRPPAKARPPSDDL